jgi:hypothetical protein
MRLHHCVGRGVVGLGQTSSLYDVSMTGASFEIVMAVVVNIRISSIAVLSQRIKKQYLREEVQQSVANCQLAITSRLSVDECLSV